MPGEETPVFLGEAVLRLLRVLAPQAGCVLVLEDLHWADQETLALLEYLADNLAAERVLCLATLREAGYQEGGEAAALASALAARGSAAMLALGRLDPTAMADMARACLDAAHLPAAVYEFVAGRAEGIPFLVEEVLAGLVGEGALTERDGRWHADYRLIGTAATMSLLARSGIGPRSVVVFHGYAAALGFWLMKLYGHDDVRILDCSRDAWRDEGHPMSTQPSEPAAAGYVLPGPDPRLRAGHAAVRDAIGRPGRALLDVRSWDEYRGGRFWPSGGLERGGRAGHVPSAVHQPIDGLYDERGAFRDPAALRGVFSAVDLDGADELITYCTIGGRACTAWFVLTYLLGRDRVRVYDGSWAEWGRMADAPVEQA